MSFEVSARDSLDRLLRPRSIAIVGASSSRKKLGGRIIPFLDAHGYTGELLPVNPNRAEIGGRPTVESIRRLPTAPDLALVLLPAELVVDAVTDCVAEDIPNVIVYSAGFGEAGAEGEVATAALLAAVEGTGTRMLGPNSEGLIDVRAGIPLTFSPVFDRDLRSAPLPVGDIAVISQSGGLGFGIADQVGAAGLGIRAVVSTGNELDLEVSDFVQHFAADEETAQIVVLVEALKHPGRFAAACASARAAGKRVIASSIGRTAVGGRAVQAHTGKLATRAGLYEALFRSAGVVAADDLDDLLDLVLTFARARAASSGGRRVAVFTSSGGGGIWASDLAVAAGLEVPQLSIELQDRLHVHLPAFAPTANPVDGTGHAHTFSKDGMVNSIRELDRSGEVDGMLLVGSFGFDSQYFGHPELPDALASAVKPVVAFSYTTVHPIAERVLREAGVPVFTSPRRAVRALCALLRAGAPAEAHEPGAARPAVDGDLVALLGEHDVTLNPAIACRSVDDAVSASKEVGLPVVMKVASPDIRHKTEVGGVVTGLRREADVRRAFDAIRDAVAERAPEAAFAGVTVERELAGHELLLGAINDPQVGPVLSLAHGGIWVELTAEPVYALAPLTPSQADALVADLPLAAALRDGYRHLPPADLRALGRLVSGFSEAVARYGRSWAAIELNPIIAWDGGAVAVDVLEV